MFAKPIEIIKPSEVDITFSLSKKNAKLLISLLKDWPEFAELKKDIEIEFSTEYRYEVKCSDCNHKFTVLSKEKLTQEILDRGGICASCSDDYK